MTVERDSAATIHCSSLTRPKWYYNAFDSLRESTLILKSLKLSLHNVALNNAGYYYCYGADIDTKRMFFAKVHVIVLGEYYNFCSTIMYSNNLLVFKYRDSHNMGPTTFCTMQWLSYNYTEYTGI